jgi:hypothetical protein
MLAYQTIYINFFHQIHYLFENRLSDKFYFCNFTHVVLDFRKNQITTSGGNLRGVPLLLFF